MAWTTLANSTTADAEVVNDNFYHVRQGDLMPLGGAGMAATTGVYNIGTSATSWYGAHVDNLFVNTAATFHGNITAEGDINFSTNTTIQHNSLPFLGQDINKQLVLRMGYTSGILASLATKSEFSISATYCHRVISAWVVWREGDQALTTGTYTIQECGTMANKTLNTGTIASNNGVYWKLFFTYYTLTT